MNFLLEISLAGALLVVLITIVRALAMHKLPKRTFLMLWGVVLIRLLVPVSIPAQTSVFNLRGMFGAGRISEPNLVVHYMEEQPFSPPATPSSAVQPDFVAMNTGAAYADEVVFLANSDSNWFALVAPLTLIYFAGLFLLAMFFAVAYVRHLRHFAASLPVRNDFVDDWLDAHSLKRRIRVRVLDTIDTPLTYGIFRPIILLPKDTDWGNEDELRYVLSHEYVHIRRFDALSKLIVAVALCIHWFNPLVWVMYFLFNRDMEISCDEAVVNMCGFGKSSKQAYALTLIGLMERKSRIPMLYNNFSEHAIEERINAIMKMKKGTIAGTLASLVLVVTTTTVFATSSVERNIPPTWETPVTNAQVDYQGQERQFNTEYRYVTVELNEGSMSASEAARIGGNALELLFGADLSDLTFHMSYSHGTDADSAIEIVNNWANELGMTASELIELSEWPRGWDDPELVALADALGIPEEEFFRTLMRANTISSPSMWFANIMPESDWSARDVYQFTVNAETGELLTAWYTPRAIEAQAAGVGFPSLASQSGYQYTAFGIESMEEVRNMLNALLEGLSLDEQHNILYANRAMEAVQILDIEAARAKIYAHHVGRDVFFEPVEIVIVMVQCVNGEHIEVGFQRNVNEEEIVLTYVQLRNTNMTQTVEFDWVELQ